MYREEMVCRYVKSERITSASPTRTLVDPMIQRLDSTAKGLDDIANMRDFGQLVVQLVDGGKDRTSAGNLRIRITDHIPCAVITVLDGELHLFL